MDVNAIGQLIGSVGFPIACCIFLFKQTADMTKILSDFKETLKDVSNQLQNINQRLMDIEKEK